MGERRKKEKVEKTSKVERAFSAGGVVYKGDKWLLTKSAPSDLYPKQVWRLPKGWIDEGETIEEAALREVREEGGVEAVIIKKIETVKYFFTTQDKNKILKFATFYLMEWIKNLPEGFDEETSEVIWLPFEEAYKLLSYPGEKQILKKAKETLNFN